MKKQGVMNKRQAALSALPEKYSEGISDMRALTHEQKAWIEIKIRIITETSLQINIMKQVSKINRKLRTATEDIPDNELQKIVLFVFENKGKNNCADTFGRGL